MRTLLVVGISLLLVLVSAAAGETLQLQNQTAKAGVGLMFQAGDQAFVGADRTVHKVDLKNHTKLWQAQVGTSGAAMPRCFALDSARNRLFVTLGPNYSGQVPDDAFAWQIVTADTGSAITQPTLWPVQEMYKDGLKAKTRVHYDSCAFFKGDLYVATQNQYMDNAVVKLDLDTGSMTTIFGTTTPIGWLKVSPDGETLVATGVPTSYTGEVKAKLLILKKDDGDSIAKVIRTIEVPLWPRSSAVFTPNTSVLTVWGPNWALLPYPDKRMALMARYDAATGKELLRKGWSEGDGLAVAFSGPETEAAYVLRKIGTNYQVNYFRTNDGLVLAESAPLNPGDSVGLMVLRQTNTDTLVVLRAGTDQYVYLDLQDVPRMTFIAGATDSAGFNKDRGVTAESMLFTLFGANLANASANATTLPLPTALGDTRITMKWAGQADPVPVQELYVGPNQVNVVTPQIPAGAASVDFVVWGKQPDGTWTPSSPFTVNVVEANPGIFIKSWNTGLGAIQTARSGEMMMDVTEQNPAKPGDPVSIYANGLGALVKPVQPGVPPTEAIQCVLPITVTIGGMVAEVLYAGVAYGQLIYQVNVRVPQGLAPGPQPVVITVKGTKGDVTSNTAQILVAAN